MARDALSGIEVVAPYGNANAAYHFRLKADYLTFCGRNCESWIVLETTFSEAIDDPYTCKRCYKRGVEMTEASNIFDCIGQRVFEAKANTKAEAVAICINEAGLDALCLDDRINRQGINRADIAKLELFGLPFKILADRPKDNFPDHWRFYLEYRTK